MPMMLNDGAVVDLIAVESIEENTNKQKKKKKKKTE